MKTREEFQAKLEDILGSEYVYFQPPDGLQMNRGNRIVYSREKISFDKADNIKYRGYVRYSVILISKDPDWPLFLEFPTLFRFCDHERGYKSDNLNHEVYTLYY